MDNFRCCTVCAKTFSGMENYQQHVMSEKHKRKIEIANRLTSISSSTSNITLNQTRIEVGAQPKGFFCSVCDVQMSGPESYQAHMDGIRHMKKVKNLELMGNVDRRLLVTQQKSFSNVSTASTTNYAELRTEVKTEMPISSLPNAFFCEICDVQMTGPESYRDHLNGARHAKKVRNANPQNNILPWLRLTEQKSGSSSYDLESTSSVSDYGASNDNNNDEVTEQITIPKMSNGFYCDVCEISMTGPESYRDHMRGAPHAKKVKLSQMNFRTDPTEVTKDTAKTIEMGNSQFFCEVCHVMISGKLNFDQHINGVNHFKKMQKKAILPVQPNQSGLVISGDAAVVRGDTDRQHLKLNEYDVLASSPSSNSSVYNESVEGQKTLDELKESIPDVLFCDVDQDPREVLGLSQPYYGPDNLENVRSPSRKRKLNDSNLNTELNNDYNPDIPCKTRAITEDIERVKSFDEPDDSTPKRATSAWTEQNPSLLTGSPMEIDSSHEVEWMENESTCDSTIALPLADVEVQ